MYFLKNVVMKLSEHKNVTKMVYVFKGKKIKFEIY